ncbi:MAG: transglutaminase family protein [Chloroflexi bacterium]|nr:MAG: transglutaminase family protein [Chloroflexota bacterium]
MAMKPQSVDWASARRASYLVRQTFRYEYSQPIRDLSHRLIVIPPERFGDQRRLAHQFSVALDGATVENRSDRFGNVILDVFAARVPNAIEFTAEVSVLRQASQPNRLPDGWLADGYLLEPSRLTAADDRILRAADDLAGAGDWGLQLADRINDWVYQSMTYRHGLTGVRTTAAEALALGAGVCQDYAHVMLAVCRVCGLPSRYVSGHLLGQGGTHAWVEVVLPTRDGTGDAIAHAFDPTHASRGGLGYVTVAVGADYSDVAPTSGTYRSGARGSLTATKRVTLTDLE